MSSEPIVKPPAVSKSVIFVRRLTSSVVLWTVVLLSIFASNRLLSSYLFLIMMMTLAGLGLAEFYNLVRRGGLVCFKAWGIFGGLLLIGSTFFYVSGLFVAEKPPSSVNDFETSFLIFFVLGLCIRQFLSKSNTAGILAISTTLFGLL